MHQDLRFNLPPSVSSWASPGSTAVSPRPQGPRPPSRRSTWPSDLKHGRHFKPFGLPKTHTNQTTHINLLAAHEAKSRPPSAFLCVQASANPGRPALPGLGDGIPLGHRSSQVQVHLRERSGDIHLRAPTLNSPGGLGGRAVEAWGVFIPPKEQKTMCRCSVLW